MPAAKEANDKDAKPPREETTADRAAQRAQQTQDEIDSAKEGNDEELPGGDDPTLHGLGRVERQQVIDAREADKAAGTVRVLGTSAVGRMGAESGLVTADFEPISRDEADKLQAEAAEKMYDTDSEAEKEARIANAKVANERAGQPTTS